MSNWLDHLSAATARHKHPELLTYIPRPPATPEQLLVLEQEFGPLPQDLRSFLLTANGVTDQYDWPAMWGAQEIVERNRALRADAGVRGAPFPYDHFLFFADNGLGDHFGYCLRPLGSEVLGALERWSRSSFARDMEMSPGDIVLLWHEDLTLRKFADDLGDFVDGWFSGERGS
ncbi:MAG TPA: SMI1/KNR4 family protein [Urbifossiella sp.]|nr:SMI1/KNR4 family protein [Urbifossiella sp.]